MIIVASLVFLIAHTAGLACCTFMKRMLRRNFALGEGRKGNFHLIMFALHFADLCYMLFYNFLIRCYRVRIMWPVLQTVQAIHSLIRFSMLMPLWEKKIIPFQFYIFTVQRLLSGRLGMQDSIGKPNYGSHIIIF